MKRAETCSCSLCNKFYTYLYHYTVVLEKYTHYNLVYVHEKLFKWCWQGDRWTDERGCSHLKAMLFTLSSKTRKQDGRNTKPDGVVPGHGHVATQLWHPATGGPPPCSRKTFCAHGSWPSGGGGIIGGTYCNGRALSKKNHDSKCGF